MLFTGTMEDPNLDLDGNFIFKLKTKNRKAAGMIYEKLKNHEVDFEIKKHYERRSLDANAYAWALIGKIAEKVGKGKDDVYFDMLKDYGQSEMMSVLSSVDLKDYHKYIEPMGTGHIGGEEFTHYKIYKGTSKYNRKEMSIFIDGVVELAESLDIEVKTPEELARMKSLWAIGV